MLRTLLSAVVALAAVAVTSPDKVSAATIVFTHEGSSSTPITGTLDGTAFSTTGFVIEAVADTDDIESFGSGVSIDHLSATIEILGLGTYDFLSPTRTFSNISSQVVGFSRGGLFGSDLFNGPRDIGPDLLSNFGPASGNGNIIQWTQDDILTSAGILNLNNASITATFTATVAAVPLPAAGWLLVAAVGGLAVARRKA